MKYLAVYLRLSNEDDDGKDESNSISNQRKQIYKYIHHDSELSKCEMLEFCDDGYTGTNMERPGMQKLLKEVKACNIRCIIVKDMSRFSRDYIEMGSYLNQIFPFMGIRFISINDHYDSREHYGTTIEIDVAFQTLLYDLYSKDLSVKVKASFENKCANGEYVFGQVPFGYKKSQEVKNAVVVNEKEAAVVRYIFSLAIQGESSVQIAKRLHEEKVPTITQMRKPDKKDKGEKVRAWSDDSVRKMLSNRFYLGEMAYGKSVRKSVGSKAGIQVPMEEWKVIKNHHEALISEEVFEQASRFKSGHSTKRKREKHPLTGKLYCGGCGYSLSYKLPGKEKRSRRFECRKHALLQIPECCTCISADILEETVMLMLNKELMLRGNAVKQKQSLISSQMAQMASLKKEMEKYHSEMKQARAKRDSLYEQYALKSISKEAYQNDTNELAEKTAILSGRIDETAGKLEKMECEYRKTEEDMKQIIRYSHIEKLTQDLVDTFISKVYVYRNKRVEIEWSFGMNQGNSQENVT